ncbi:MAG: hypothetical protein Q8M29_00955 [Bacteroidota bacterium]|nr:hypothetical protein [Bacteroidota bacterium]
MLQKEDLIKYIQEKDFSYQKSYLESLNLEALVILKVQIELSIHRQETLKQNKNKDFSRKKN